jgi:hypothetical protein
VLQRKLASFRAAAKLASPKGPDLEPMNLPPSLDPPSSLPPAGIKPLGIKPATPLETSMPPKLPTTPT